MLRGRDRARRDIRHHLAHRFTRREPIIDAEPNTIEETDSPHLARVTSAQPRMLRALLDHTRKRSGLGQRRVFERAPLSTSDIVPEGTRFIEGTHSNPAGSRAYRLYHPQPLSAAAASFGRHATWLHPVTRRFRRRHEDELFRRRTNLLCGLACTAR